MTPFGRISGGPICPVVTGSEMREIDRLSSEEHGISGDQLMERAGRGAAEAILERFPRHVRDGVVLVAGKGNNGGDALVIARRLRRAKVRCRVFLAADPGSLTEDAGRNLDRWRKARRRVEPLGSGGQPDFLDALSSCGLVVDALFGTGLRGELRDPGLSIVRAMNLAPCPIVAIDVPSGLDADRGVPVGEAVQASMTVTFAFPKIGLLLHPGVELAGEVAVVDIGVAPEAVASVAPMQELLTSAGVGATFPGRPAESHKGSHGHVLVIGGSSGMEGAALLAGRAALRAGAGLVTLGTPAGFIDRGRTPELMVRLMPEAWKGAEVALPGLLTGKTAVVFGPGLGDTRERRRLARWIVDHVDPPLVIDADGLNALANRKRLIARRRGATILTPHPGEAGRLLGCATAAVQNDRPLAVRALARETGAIVVLKGAGSLIATPDGRLAINPTGNPGMGSGGMGDVLAGIAGALLAQGLPAGEAATTAVFWHGFAANEVATRRGEAGLLASDVVEELPPARRQLEREACGEG